MMERVLKEYKDFDISTESGYKEMQSFLSDKTEGMDYEMRRDTFRNYVDNREIQRVYLYGDM